MEYGSQVKNLEKNRKMHSTLKIFWMVSHGGKIKI